MHDEFLIENIKFVNILKTFTGLKDPYSKVGTLRFNYLTFNDCT